MDKRIEDKILGYFKLKEDSIIEFKKMYGFTFVFLTRIITLKDRVSSAEIKPLGIIYDENGEYYFAPLDKIKNLDEIVEKYVMEEECFRFQQ